MALATGNAADISISGSINVSNINYAIRNLISNDLAVGSDAIHPKVWECSWYNKDKSELSGCGYSAGDMVWLNTENVDQFVLAHERDIYNYAISNSKTKYQVQQLSGEENRTKLLQLYQDIVDGQNGYDRLYYLGCISDCVQIRVSLSDCNTDYPTDDSHWKDFIRRDLNEDYYRTSILSSYRGLLSARFFDHLAKYHLFSMLSSGGKAAAECLKQYLLADFSNLSTSHYMLNHQYQTEMRGCDYVTDYQYAAFPNGCFKWYRKWNSGLLEHGGTLHISSYAVTGDELIYGDDAYKVNLDFTRLDQTPAPVYDYPTIKFGSFYKNDKFVDLKNDQGEYAYLNGEDDLGQEYRYDVSITKLAFPAERPYSRTNAQASHTYYSTTDVMNMTNKSFAVNCVECPGFTYEVRGFTTVA